MSDDIRGRVDQFSAEAQRETLGVIQFSWNNLSSGGHCGGSHYNLLDSDRSRHVTTFQRAIAISSANVVHQYPNVVQVRQTRCDFA